MSVNHYWKTQKWFQSLNSVIQRFTCLAAGILHKWLKGSHKRPVQVSSRVIDLGSRLPPITEDESLNLSTTQTDEHPQRVTKDKFFTT